MSFSWNATKWAGPDPAYNGRTGFFIGGFMRSTKAYFEKIDGYRAEKVRRFKKLCMEAFQTIIDRTPVDTELAKNSWVISFEDDGTTVKCSITNPVFYVIFLEYGAYGTQPNGWSRQAPNGMVRITLREFAEKVRGQ